MIQFKEKYNEVVLCLFIATSFFYQKLQPILIVLLLAGLFYKRTSFENFKQRLNYKNTSLYFILFFMLHIVGVIYSEQKDIAWTDIGMKASFLVFPIYFLFIRSISKKFIFDLFSIFGSISVIICVVVALYKYFIFGHNVLRFESEFSIFIHRSYQSIYWALGAVWGFYSFVQFEKNKWLSILVSIILSVGVFLTYSKAGMLILVICLFLLLGIFIVRKRKFKLSFFTILGGALLIIIINQITPKPKARLEAMISAITNQEDIKKNQESSNQARVIMWTTSIDVITEHVVFGVGTGDVKKTLKQKNTINGFFALVKANLNSHNQFLNSGVALGLLGMTLLILTFFSNFLFSSMMDNENWISIIFSIIIFLFMLTESAFETQAGIITFTFLMCLFNLKNVIHEK